MNNNSLLGFAALLLLAGLGPALRAAEPAAVIAEETITLPKFQVQGNAICSFGIGIIATWDKKNQSIGHVYVDDVSPGSEAEKIGLKRGDEILSLNGKKITDMKGGMRRGSDLFELLVNQPIGRTIDVEVAVRVVKKVVLTATP
jgi:S1-C subfamily serine protease